MGLRSSVQKSDGKIRNGTTRISEPADGEIAVPQSGPSGGRCHGKNARRRIGKSAEGAFRKAPGDEPPMVWTLAVGSERRVRICFQIKDCAFDPGCGDGVSRMDEPAG